MKTPIGSREPASSLFPAVFMGLHLLLYNETAGSKEKKPGLEEAVTCQLFTDNIASAV